MNGMEVHCETQEDIHWVSFPTIATREIPVPQWAESLLGEQPQQAAQAGPDNGYLILAMASDCDIASLPAPGDALTSLTRRSLIVTRRVSAASSRYGENIQYRYFAPQYGQPEDTATGSAMRAVAAYWQGRDLGDELKALQCSADGGWLQSRIKDGRTWIGGRVIDEGEAA